MISLTQTRSNARICIEPEVFILHQPRRMRLELPGKRPFSDTTLMSIFSPQITIGVTESYESISRILVEDNPSSFAEFIHGETGTKFVCSPKYFILVDIGYYTGFPKQVGDVVVEEQTDVVSLLSTMNPAVWVPVKGKYDEVHSDFWGINA